MKWSVIHAILVAVSAVSIVFTAVCLFNLLGDGLNIGEICIDAIRVYHYC